MSLSELQNTRRELTLATPSEGLKLPAGTAAVPSLRPAAGITTALFDGQTLSLALVMSIAMISHVFNIFNYPVYHQDEGILGQQAWSFLQNRSLSPYTYNYDHPPFATFMLAFWTLITGGFHTFGPAINGSRVLMLVLHLCSTFFLYQSARRLTNSTGAAMITGVLFSLSPLAVNYQRMAVVDNFMVFWLMAGLYFTVNSQGRLFRLFMASLAIGLAVVSKETAVIFLPAFLILLWLFADRYHRLFAIWGGLMISFLVSFQYLLYAVLKGELFPDNFNFQGELDGKATHVSLFGTLFQNYYTATPIWQDNPALTSLWEKWLALDSVLIFAGAGCMLLNLAFGIKFRENWVVPLLGVSYGLFMAFGGASNDVAIVTFVPFLALAVGQTIGWAARLLGPTVTFVTVPVILALASFFYIAANSGTYTSQVNQPFQQTVNWIKSNIPADSKLVINDAIWVDLHDKLNGPAFPLALSHWKVARDPAIYYDLLKGNYNNVDYLVLTDEMRGQFKDFGEKLPTQALENSSLIRRVEGPGAVEIRKVNNQKPLVTGTELTDAYQYYKNRFVHTDGKVTDGQDRLSAKQQANTMLLAVFNDDQRTFDNLWFWAAYNLQLNNSLFVADAALSEVRSHNSPEIYTNSQTDIDFGMALLLAGKRWKDTSYTKEALYIIKSIWNNEVIQINKRPFLKATNAGSGQLEDQVLINLGAYTPYAFRLFADLDKSNDWQGLINSGYELLNKAAWYGRGDYQGSGLPPGMVIMNLESEDLRAVDGTFGGRLGDFDEDAQQAVWRVVLDYNLFQSDQARAYIQTTGWFLIKYWQKWQDIPTRFSSNGLPIDKSENLLTYNLASSQAKILDQLELERKRALGLPVELNKSSTETEIISRVFMGSFYRYNGLGFWVQKDDIDSQIWGWFATALHVDKLNFDFEQPVQ